MVQSISNPMTTDRPDREPQCLGPTERRESFMVIRFAAQDGHSAVELFDEEEAYHLV